MNKRKWLVIVLALAMVLTMLPAMALADEVPVNDLDSLKAALQQNAQIKLTANIELTEQLSIPEGVTIDGGGNTISIANDITWSTSDPTKYLILVSGNNVTIKNVTLDADNNAAGCLQFFKAEGGKIENVTLANAKEHYLPLNVNGSKVTATGYLNVEGNANNGKDYVINVGCGTSATGNASSFDISSATLDGVAFIYADKTDLANSSNEISITTPEGYLKIGDPENADVADGLVYSNSIATAQVNDGKGYVKLLSAVDAAQDGDTVTLMNDASGSGIVIDTSKYATKGLTIDFNNHTYTVNEEPLAGSSGTESQCFQLLTGGSVIMKNGTIKADNGHVAMLIQNYCNLTLSGMKLEGNTMTRTDTYALSNNCGNVKIVDTTITAKEGEVAFDVYGGFQSYGDVTVTVSGNSVINGTVEVARGAGEQNENKLYINGGTFNGALSITDDEKSKVEISGGTFTDPNAANTAKDYLADGFKLSANGTVKKESSGGFVQQKTLTFDTNGGSKIDAVTANYGKTIVLADYTPKRSGYDFVGWYKDEKLTEKIEYAILDYDMTVYAKWTANGEPTDDATVETKIVLVINDKTAVVDGNAVSNDVAPLIVNGRTYTPARFVAEALGAKVDWNEATRTVTITKGDTSIVLIVDTTTAYVNGEAVKMDASAFIVDGRTFTPCRFVAEQLGANVEWDEATRSITIIQYAE